jgi:hypothetical protein
MPAVNATTGMPAAMAFFTAGAMAGGSGSVTAMPSTLLSMALWMSVACLPESGSEEYLKSTLSFAAAACAPLRMMSQKVSPGAPCVTIAIVILGVSALPAPTALFALSSACLPPVLLQPASTRATPATSAAQRSLVVLAMPGPPVIVGVARY